jgi:integrase/recombinase XerD
MHEMLVPLFTAIAKRGGAAFRTHRNEPYPITDDETKGQVSSAIAGARRRSGIKDISPYTGRHTVSTQLVINGVHEYIKDQILGHSVTSMSRLYVQVPQRPLIEAINTLPVIPAWRDAPWMLDPIKWQRRLVRYENNGRSGAKSTKPVQHLPEWSIND